MNSAAEDSSQNLAPLLLLAAVGVVLAAQWASAVPIAAAVALAGWGSALALVRRRERFLLAAVVYAPLVLLAIGAQLDAAGRSESLFREFLAAVDAGAAGALVFQLGRRAVAA
jgi:hypothetical protein